jgi:hypothetical protein
MASADQHLKAIEETLANHPEIGERTAAFLASEPSRNTVDALRDDTLDYTLVVKVHRSLLDRAEQLRPSLSASPQFQATGRLTRSAVIRLAILKGLEVLERDVSAVGELSGHHQASIEIIPTPISDTTGTPTRSKKWPLQGMRKSIVDALRPYPEGLAPIDMRERLGMTQDLGSTMKAMARDGILTRVKYGHYAVADGW